MFLRRYCDLFDQGTNSEGAWSPAHSRLRTQHLSVVVVRVCMHRCRKKSFTNLLLFLLFGLSAAALATVSPSRRLLRSPSESAQPSRGAHGPHDERTFSTSLGLTQCIVHHIHWKHACSVRSRSMSGTNVVQLSASRCQWPGCIRSSTASRLQQHLSTAAPVPTLPAWVALHARTVLRMQGQQR